MDIPTQNPHTKPTQPRTKAMQPTIEPLGATQRALLRALLHNQPGLTIDALGDTLAISRNAVRQHIAALERDGLLARGATQPTGGRPEQLYVLTDLGRERFPRQYTWLSEVMLRTLRDQLGPEGLAASMEAMGRAVADDMLAAAPDTPLATRIATLNQTMGELGYDTLPPEPAAIEARNCVFHKLAAEIPEVCRFDIALASQATGREVEHQACMVRGDPVCRFYFVPPTPPK
jgi:predicted ArsR family transcriptional regulator